MSAKYITQEDIDGAASDEVPIVIGFHSDNPFDEPTAHKRYVPADWYNDFLHATRMKHRVEQSLGAMPGVVSIGVSPGERGGDNSRLIVRLQDSDVRTMMGEIPTHVEGVKIDVESVSGFESISCTDTLRNWSSSTAAIRGGYEVRGNSNAPIGSVGAPAFKNGKRYLATCQHIFSGNDATGSTLKHPDGTSLGTVKHTKCKEDYAMVKLHGRYRIERAIRYSGYNGISGHFSYDGLGHLKSRGVNTQKVGRTTCRTSFSKIQTTAETIYTAPGCLPKPYSVFHKDNSSGNDLKRGDSGSISFYESPNNSNKCWLVSFINYEDGKTNDVFGIGIYRLADFGYNF
ncbi:hypothetical protein [Halocatena salina]|uniref:Uncharacterized protein n=1 Tax=Halocatena salina TaxID=2934340 RepID=A0A8T9ZZZ9_9EURY|nr:hypothetical protein [Halocatena salina]UPM42410.1 hypothetical protein MW046_10640 [Halocatena salina]